ncbi:O-antigen ligase family protein [Pseudomonas sp. Q1-7]|uniref:O-antigen ligase family protein n=1 Tax=Pseudomonas sp. Q1-7 TaxID=3020843 RepID=UPI0023001775|nr:O-antigen ligase family protein [Pseudomonas sp. Q1-7]
MVMPVSTSAHIYDFIGRRWLPVGYLVLLTGLFWVLERSHYSKSFYALIVLPALIAALMRPAILGQILRNPVVQAFLLFSAWLLLSLAWTASTDNPGSLAKRPLYVFMLFVGCSVIALQEERLLLVVLRMAGLIAAVAAVVNLAQFALQPPTDGRLAGTGGLMNPLLTSHLLGFFCTYWLAAWATHQERVTWLPLLALVPLIAATLATGSRTPLMAILVSAVWLALLAKGRRSLTIVALLGLAGVALATLLPDAILQRGLSLRPQIWQAALSQVSDHLWLGRGYGSEFQFLVPGVDMIWSDPHNVELAVLLELGLVGLALWLLMYGLALGQCLRSGNHPAMKLASCLLIYGLAAGLTEGSNFLSRPNENWFLTWLPLSVVVALSILQRLKERA